MSDNLLVFIHHRNDLPKDKHFTIVADHPSEFRKIIISDLAAHLGMTPSVSAVKPPDGLPLFRQMHADLMSVVNDFCDEGDRFVIIAHHKGPQYHEIDQMIIEAQAKDYRFELSKVIVVTCEVFEDNKSEHSESLYELHFA